MGKFDGIYFPATDIGPSESEPWIVGRRLICNHGTGRVEVLETVDPKVPGCPEAHSTIVVRMGLPLSIEEALPLVEKARHA